MCMRMLPQGQDWYSAILRERLFALWNGPYTPGMRRLVMFFAVVAGRVPAADVETAIRTTFVRPWIEAVRSNDRTRIDQFTHPKVRACRNEETREYFEFRPADELSGAKAAYHITKLAPWNGPGPLWTLPADGFSYPVQPTYELNLQFEGSNTVVIRYLAPNNGAWYSVEPCPNEKGMAYFRTQQAEGKAQKKRAAELVVQLKDPLLSELKTMLKQHRLMEAAKRYQAATGLEDFTTAVLVMNELDPEHPLGQR